MSLIPKKLFVLFFFVLSTFCLAKHPLEIIGRPAEYHEKNVRFQFQLDFRNSFVGKKVQPIQVYGVNIGIKIKERYRYGIGFYYVNQLTPNELGYDNQIKQIRVFKGEYVTEPTYFAKRQLLLFYGTVNFTYTIIKHKFINVDLPLEIGFGYYDTGFEGIRISESLDIAKTNEAQVVLNNTKQKKLNINGTFVPILFGVATTIKLHRYFYPQFSGGYRKSVLESDFKADFDGFYYHIGYQIHFGEIYKDIFKKKPPVDL